jgi:hypothetical protein
MSSAAAMTDTVDAPDRLSSDPVDEDVRVRVRVVPDVVYVPVPISQAVPFWIRYRTASVFATPAAAKV